MSNSTSQGVYSPLPQSISDTESEEELHSAIPQSKFKDVTKHLNGSDQNYHHLNDDDNHLNGFPNINTNMDDTPIIKDNYKKPMSPIRKLLFSLSILICFLTIVIFLWVLPCSEDSTCPALTKNTKISNWEKEYHGIELIGPINVVKGINGHCKNLIILFRGDVINDNPVQGLQKVSSKGGGAISIMGDTGNVAWYVPRPRLPYEIDCNILDVDLNGDPDCIMSGSEGMLEVIDPVSGAIKWAIHFHNNDIKMVTSIEFPIIVPDINDDHINDLIVSGSVNNSKHNYILAVSGKMGNVLGKPFLIKNCDEVTNLAITKNEITYNCLSYSERSNSVKNLSLNELYKQIFGILSNAHNSLLKQHTKFSDDTIQNQRQIYSVNGRQLIVNNKGSCPGDCNVNVQLIDQRIINNNNNNNNNNENVIFSYNGKNVYGMVPTSMTFKNNPNNINSLQGHINGFIIKYWQFNDLTTKNDYIFNHDLITKRNIFNIKQNAPWNLPHKAKKRSLLQDKIKNTTITEQLLTERVSLITFNATNYNVVNASQSDVTQLCSTITNFPSQNYPNKTCQPDLTLQKNSVLLADIDNDGSKELVTYLSTFILSNEFNENESKYLLQSSVKIVRLESELQKLYEAVTTKN